MLGISVNRHGNIQSRKKNTKQRQPAKKIRPGSEVELYLRRTKWANRSFARPGLMVRNKLCWDRQITQCDFQNKGTLTSVARLFFVLSLIALFASLHKKTSFRFVSNILWFVMLICVSSRTLMWREQQTLNPNTSHNRERLRPRLWHLTLLYIYRDQEPMGSCRDINVSPPPNQNETEKNYTNKRILKLIFFTIKMFRKIRI